MKSFFRSCFLFFVVFLLSSCASMTTVRKAPECDSTLTRANKISVLPPGAEVNTVDVLGKKKRMYDYESYLEKVIAKEIVPVIQAKGYRVKVLRNFDINKKKLSNDFASVRRRYNEIREELYSKPLWKEEEAFAISKNVGSRASNFVVKTDSDVLLIVDYVGSTKTNGARALNFAADLLLGGKTVSSAEDSIIILGLIDAKTGKVLWTNISSQSQDLFGSMWDSATSSPEKIDVKKTNILISNALEKLKDKHN